MDDGAAADADVPVLIEPDQGWIVDDEAAAVASEAVGDIGSVSAEETAINVIDEDAAPGLTWGRGAGYLDDDAVERPPGFNAGAAEAGAT